MMIIVKEADIQIERLELGPWPTNAYIVSDPKTKDSLVVDAPAEAEVIIERLRGSNPKYLLLTHNHMDHLGALLELHSKLMMPVGVHPLDAGDLPLLPDILLKDGDIVSLGNIKFDVIHTPGHTSGSICFKRGKYLISGDTIFPGGPGMTKSPADFREIITSITEKLFILPDDTQIYPGHGNPTVLKKEEEEFAIFASRPHRPDLCGDVVWLTS